MRLSIVIPAYNEERRLGRMLDDYAPYFRERYGDEAELIVVVNGSTDGTEAVARRCAAEHRNIRVLVDPRPIGKGGAIMAGMAGARGAWIGFADADGATPPPAFDDLTRRIGDAGLILANRWDPASIITPQPWRRRVASRVFNALVRFLFGLNIRDTQCGAKLLRRETALAVLPKLGLTRWAFDVDLLFQVRRAGFAIAETPTVWHDTEGSRLRVARASLDMFVAIARLRLLYSPFRFVVRLYDRTIGPLVHRPLGPPPASAGQPETDQPSGNERH